MKDFEREAILEKESIEKDFREGKINHADYCLCQKAWVAKWERPYMDGFYLIDNGEVIYHRCKRDSLASSTQTDKGFYNLIQNCDARKLLERLHVLIDGKKGKAVGLVFLKCYLDKLITRMPTQKEAEAEFDIKGVWSGISKYMVLDHDAHEKAALQIEII